MFELLINGDLYAPSPSGPCHILIAGERIAWIGDERPDLPRALDVTVTDLEGRRVIPGLVDCHVHITGGGGEDGFQSRIDPLPARSLFAAGTTTVVGVLGTDDTTRDTAGLVAAARKLRHEGLGAFCMTGGYHVPPVTLTGSIRGDLVHVDPILGAGEIAVSDHRSSQPTLDELLRVASEVHVGGMLARKAGVVHLHVGDGPRGLSLIEEALDRSELPAGVFHPTHVNRRAALFDEALVLARRGCAVDVTAFPEGPDEEGIPAREAIEKYLSSGAPEDRLTVSSDAGGSLPCFDGRGKLLNYEVQAPGRLAGLLAELVDGGMPLERALPPFTSNPAGLLRLEGKGVLRKGASADLAVLGPGGEIEEVMSRGAWRVRKGLHVEPAAPADHQQERA